MYTIKLFPTSKVLIWQNEKEFRQTIAKYLILSRAGNGTRNEKSLSKK